MCALTLTHTQTHLTNTHTHAGKKIADYWDVSKKIMMDTRFIDKLKEYDRDNIQV